MREICCPVRKFINNGVGVSGCCGRYRKWKTHPSPHRRPYDDYAVNYYLNHSVVN